MTAALLLSSCGTTKRTASETETQQKDTSTQVDRDIITSEKITADIPLSILLQGLGLPERPRTAQGKTSGQASDSSGTAESGSYNPSELVTVTIDRTSETKERTRQDITERSDRETESTETIERKSPFSGFRLGLIVALLLLGAGVYLAIRFNPLSLLR